MSTPATRSMHTTAVVFDAPHALSVRDVELVPPTSADVVVETHWSGISSGTERLLWTGQMPPFPGLAYPLVPGYECVGRVSEAGSASGRDVGSLVYVSGSRAFTGVHGLFGGQAARIVAPGARTVVLDAALAERGTLLALAATAQHALTGGAPTVSPDALPDLIIGHGALGRLLARLVILHGGPTPTVWESNPTRRNTDSPYVVIDPHDDPRRDYRRIVDASGAVSALDTAIERLARGGEICLAGFYHEPVRFAYPPAFLREIRLRIAAQWSETDLTMVAGLANAGALPLHDLISHTRAAADAHSAYTMAFDDPACLKMVLDWSNPA